MYGQGRMLEFSEQMILVQIGQIYQQYSLDRLDIAALG